MATSGYVVYRATNRLNGNFYIGITKRTIEKRWAEHTRHCGAGEGRFYRALRKYGKEAFELEEVSRHQTLEEVKAEEIRLIATLKPVYNSTLGGDGSPGHFVSEDVRRKMADLHRGNKYNLGRRWTEEQRMAMSKKKVGCQPPRPTEKMIAARLTNCLMASIGRRRPVKCETTGEIFESVTAAGNAHGLRKESVSKVCQGRRNAVYGLVFRFCEAA